MFMFLLFFFKQKTAYEMRISDWSSDVCSSDLGKFGEPDWRWTERQFSYELKRQATAAQIGIIVWLWVQWAKGQFCRRANCLNFEGIARLIVIQDHYSVSALQWSGLPSLAIDATIG